MIPDFDPILDKAATAAAIGISVMTLDRLAAAQKGPVRRQLSARLVECFRQADVEEVSVEQGARDAPLCA